jgi:hypothetical protein
MKIFTISEHKGDVSPGADTVSIVNTTNAD